MNYTFKPRHFAQQTNFRSIEMMNIDFSKKEKKKEEIDAMDVESKSKMRDMVEKKKKN